jgi:hypothetical protein
MPRSSQGADRIGYRDDPGRWISANVRMRPSSSIFARTAGWLLKSPNLFATVISAFLFRKLEVLGWRVLHGGIALLALDELMYVGL